MIDFGVWPLKIIAAEVIDRKKIKQPTTRFAGLDIASALSFHLGMFHGHS